MITSPTDFNELLVALQEQFAWPRRAVAYEEISTWERERSGSMFHRLHGLPEGPDVVVKTVPSWTALEAESTFEAMVDLADTLDEARIAGAEAVRPLAWSGEPPTLVMPFVEGIDLISLLRQPDHPAWRNEVAVWLRSAGGMLAAYHTRHRAPGSDTAAASEVKDLANRFRIGRTFDEVDWSDRLAGSYGDYGPGNLHAASDGNLYLLDPPVTPIPGPIQRDLGNFTFELRRQLAGRGFTPSPPIPEQFERLCDAFLQGYSDHQDASLDDTDLALIALYELRRAAGMARKRFPGRLGDAFWFARSAMARRREVVASPHQL